MDQFKKEKSSKQKISVYLTVKYETQPIIGLTKLRSSNYCNVCLGEKIFKIVLNTLAFFSSTND